MRGALTRGSETESSMLEKTPSCPEATGKVVQSIRVEKGKDGTIVYVVFEDGCCLRIEPTVIFLDHGGRRTRTHQYVHLWPRRDTEAIEGLLPPSSPR